MFLIKFSSDSDPAGIGKSLVEFNAAAHVHLVVVQVANLQQEICQNQKVCLGVLNSIDILKDCTHCLQRPGQEEWGHCWGSGRHPQSPPPCRPGDDDDENPDDHMMMRMIVMII